LRHQQNVELIGTSDDALTAIEDTKKLQPDVILLDLDMPDINGLKVLPLFKKFIPEASIIIPTLSFSIHDGASAIQAGADGYVTKSVMFTELMPAIFRSII